MNRSMGKLKLLLQCLLLGVLVGQRLAQQYERYPYSNTYEDGDDYDEQGRYDNHHPLDNRGNYAYGQPSHDRHDNGDSSLDMYDQYNSREEHPTLQIYTPPTSQEHTQGHQSREENYDVYNQHHSREEIPEAHIITPPVHQEAPSRNVHVEYDRRIEGHSIDDGYAQEHSGDELPEPRIITPPVSQDSRPRNTYEEHDRRVEEHHTDDRYAQQHSRDEFPDPRVITPPVSLDSRSRNVYEDRGRRVEEHPTDDRYAQEHSGDELPEPRIITPPVSQDSRPRNTYEEHDRRVEEHHTDDRYAQPHSRDEFPAPRVITPPVSQDSRSRNVYAQEHAGDEVPEPSIITPPVSQDSRSRNTYEEQPTDDWHAQQHSRDEYPEPRIITPPVAQDSRSNDLYEYHYNREDVPEPRIITPPETPEPRRQQTHDPHYTEQHRLENESREEYQPPRVITPPESQEPTTDETYEPLHGRDDSYSHHSSNGIRSDVISVPRLGTVRGYPEFMIIKNRQVSAYLGLKYGTVRRGIGRFQPASSYQADPRIIIEATKVHSNCPQFPDLAIITEQEKQGRLVDDCLTLNIYTPARSGSYPVIVFVHGEMLFDGSAEEGQPDYFLENDVVLVTINYRLAPFGFLSTLTDDMPGNVALSDIQMSLEWVQQYISGFNGNPEQVTLMGQAAGATLIHALSISGKAQGLFHKLILQSGTALNPYFLDEQPLATLRSFANFARCPSSHSMADFATCFEHMSTTDLLTYFQKYFESNEPRGLAFTNAYKLILGDKLGYLPQHPASMVSNNTYPMIVGVTKDAGAFIMSRIYDQLDQLRSRNISDYIMVILKHTVQPRHYQLWTNWALQHIFNPEDARNPNINSLAQKLLELTNLIMYRGPVVDSIRYTSKNYPTYVYCFDYRGEYHRFGHLSNPLPFEIDATLSDDNIFLFPYPEEVSRLNPEDKSVARSIVSMWVNFAKYGVPDLDEGVWPKVTSEYGPFLRFTNGQESKLEQDYHFGDGIPVPNMYPDYFTTTTTTTTTTPRPYRPYPEERPVYPTQHPNYPQQRPVYPNYPQYPNYRSSSQNQHAPNYRGLDNTHGNSRYSNYPMRH